MARLRKKKRWGVRLFFALLALVLVGLVAARVQLTLVPPHVAFASTAKLTDEKRKQLDDAVADSMVSDRDQAIDFALDFTARSLSFSLGHPASSEFGVGGRGASSIEYADLFTVVFAAAAKHAGSSARAYRVQSDVRVFDKKLPLKAFADHDWVLVVDPADGARIYLDPTFADVWLGASIARNVKGGDAIALPR